LAGKPVIRGTRLAVDLIVGLLGQGWSEGDIPRNYPGLTHDDIAACLQYASELLQAEKVHALTDDSFGPSRSMARRYLHEHGWIGRGLPRLFPEAGIAEGRVSGESALRDGL
jgi:uncharacterized protein (DUF433 family)